MIEELKYLLKNYVALKYEFISELEPIEEDMSNGAETENSKREKGNMRDELGLKLLNEKAELLIEDKQTQIDVINMFLEDLD